MFINQSFIDDYNFINFIYYHAYYLSFNFINYHTFDLTCDRYLRLVLRLIFISIFSNSVVYFNFFSTLGLNTNQILSIL